MFCNLLLRNARRALTRRNVALCRRTLRQSPAVAIRSDLKLRHSKALCSELQFLRYKSSGSRIELDYEEFMSLIKNHDVTIIDVREPRELEEYGKIPDSVNIPLGQLSDALQMPSDKFEVRFKVKKPSEDGENVVFHCLGGVRSLKAMNQSHNLGFTKAKHYKGGWEEYAEKTGQPLKKKPDPVES